MKLTLDACTAASVLAFSLAKRATAWRRSSISAAIAATFSAEVCKGLQAQTRTGCMSASHKTSGVAIAVATGLLMSNLGCHTLLQSCNQVVSGAQLVLQLLDLLLHGSHDLSTLLSLLILRQHRALYK